MPKQRKKTHRPSRIVRQDAQQQQQQRPERTWLQHFIDTCPETGVILARLGLTAEELEVSVESLVETTPDELSLQTSMTEVYGFDALDFIAGVITHIREILTRQPAPNTPAPSQPKKQASPTPYRSEPPPSEAPRIPKNAIFHKLADRSEIFIPAVPSAKNLATKRLNVADILDDTTRPGMLTYSSLNYVQSTVYDTAYNTNANMLVCAPTGCGKTLTALLCMLREVKVHFHGLSFHRPFMQIH